MIVRVRELAAGYGDRLVVTGLSIDVSSGQAVAFRGANGAGKSTVLRCVAGLLVPRAGSITVAGRPADDRDPGFRRSVASLLDGGAWYPNLTAGEHLELIRLANDPVPGTWFTEGELTERLGVAQFSGSMPGALSSGQRQRLALAAVLSRPSQVLLLDEPERHLDEAGRLAAGALVREYCRRGGAALLATHDDELASAAGAEGTLLSVASPAGAAGP